MFFGVWLESLGAITFGFQHRVEACINQVIDTINLIVPQNSTWIQKLPHISADSDPGDWIMEVFLMMLKWTTLCLFAGGLLMYIDRTLDSQQQARIVYQDRPTDLNVVARKLPKQWNEYNHCMYTKQFQTEVKTILCMNLHDRYGEDECNGFEWNMLPSEVIKRIIKHRATMEQEQDIINENLSSI